MLRALDRLETQLSKAIGDWPVPCAGCALLGSAARRDGTTRSDLDVLVLRPDAIAVDDQAWRAQLDDTASQAERWTGNPLSWVEFDTATFTQMIAAADAICTPSWSCEFDSDPRIGRRLAQQADGSRHPLHTRRAPDVRRPDTQSPVG